MIQPGSPENKRQRCWEKKKKKLYSFHAEKYILKIQTGLSSPTNTYFREILTIFNITQISPETQISGLNNLN